MAPTRKEAVAEASAVRPVHDNIFEAMAAIHEELPAIGKNNKAPAAMGGYAFRGIDDVLNALNPLLGKHQVFYCPLVHERLDHSFTNSKGNTTFVVRLRVGYEFMHVSGSGVKCEVWGEAHDGGDKATQKALTAAQKSALFQVFAINTEDQAEMDSERQDTSELVGGRASAANQPTRRREPEPSQSEPIHPDEQPILRAGWADLLQQEKAHEELYAEIRKSPEPIIASMREWRKEHDIPVVMDRIWYDATAAKYLELVTENDLDGDRLNETTQEVPA